MLNLFIIRTKTNPLRLIKKTHLQTSKTYEIEHSIKMFVKERLTWLG